MQSKTGDVESGRDAAALYTNMLESPQLRWAFIRKVYAIILAQLLLTAGVASAIFLTKPMRHFVAKTKLGFAIYIVVLVLPLIRKKPVFASPHNALMFLSVRSFSTVVSFVREVSSFFFVIAQQLYALCARTTRDIR